MAIATVGTLSYGPVVFGALERSNVTASPRWDDANRNIVTWKHTLNVEGWIGGGTDATMQTYHNSLCTPGLALLYSGRGYGGPDGTGLHVNDGTGVFDVAYGPRPETLSFNPLGAGQAARVVWAVSTEIPHCASASFRGRPLALNYSWGVDIDERGLSVATITGYIEIPVTRISPSRTIPDNADAYRDQYCKFPVMRGYRRFRQSYKLSLDKRRLDFTVADREMEYPLPPGCTHADVRHTAKWSRDGRKAAIIFNTLSGTLTLAPDQPPEKAFEKWRTIVASRIRAAEAPNVLVNGAAGAANPAAVIGGGLAAAAGAGGVRPTIILDGLEISEEVFGRSCSFNTSWQVIGTTLKNILTVSGLFNKIKDADAFTKWQDSMNNSAFHVRGFGKETFNSSQDSIVDLCPGGQQSVMKAKVPANEAVLKAGVGAKEAVLQAIDKDQLPLIAGDGVPRNIVDPKASWIAYEIEFTITEKDKVVRHKPLTGAPGTKANSTITVAKPPTLVQTLDKVGSMLPAMKGVVDDIIQRVTAPSVNVICEGKAMRIGHRVPPLVFSVIGGVPATVVNHGCSEKVVSQVGGIPMYQMTWTTFYMLPRTPDPVILPANPALQVPPA